MLRPVQKIYIDDPRKWGYVLTRGYGLEITFEDPADSPAVKTRGVSGAPRFAFGPQAWAFDNAEYLHGLDGIIAQRQYSLQDMAVANFVTAGGSWAQCQPFTHMPKFFRQYDNVTAATTAATTVWNHTNPPGVVIYLIASDPKHATPTFRFALNANDTPKYEIVFPFDASGANQAVYQYPTLEKDGVAVKEWRNARAALAGGHHGIEWWKLVMQQFDDELFIDSSLHDDPFIYYEDGLNIPAGKIKVSATWGEFAFLLGLIEYNTTTSVATLNASEQVTIDSGFNVPNLFIKRYFLPSGTGIATTNIGAGQVFRPRVTFSPTKYATPIIRGLVAYSLPTFEAAVTAPVDVTTRANYGITYRNLRNRATTLEFDLRNNDGALTTIYPCGVVTWDVTLDEGAGEPAVVRKFTGRIDPQFTRSAGELRGLPIIKIRAQDETVLAPNKPCLWLPALGGVNWATALKALGNWGGIPNTRITVTDDGTIIDQGRWDEKLKIANDVDFLRALDLLCEVRGLWEWLINASGILIGREIPSYAGVPTHTFDQTDVAAGDIVREISEETDLRRFVNHVCVTGEDSNTDPLVAYYHNTASQTDNTRTDFVGVDLWEVETDPEQAHPELRAVKLGEFNAHAKASVEIRSAGKFSWQPGDWITINVTGLRLPYGSVIELVEQSITLSENQRPNNVMRGEQVA